MSDPLISQENQALIDAYKSTCDMIEAALKSKLRQLKKQRERLAEIDKTIELCKEHPKNVWFRKALECEFVALQTRHYIDLGEAMVSVKEQKPIEIYIFRKD